MVFSKRLTSTRAIAAANEKRRAPETAVSLNIFGSATYWPVALSTFKVTLGPIVELKTIFFM